MENKYKYDLTIKVRDSDGNLIVGDEKTDTYRLNFSLGELTDKQIISILKSTGRTLKAWMPDREISLEASIFDEISQTYMCLFSCKAGEEIQRH